MRIGEPRIVIAAMIEMRLPLEIYSAKEAKRWFDCGGKHLGCPERVSTGVCRGLQCGLSGNRAAA